MNFNEHIITKFEVDRKCFVYHDLTSVSFSEIEEEIRKEHNIMKQFIYENGLWGKFLNDDRFLEHLRSDDNA